MATFFPHHHISFFGRSFAELLQCYGLDKDELLGESILDCSAGPSSFAAEANRIGISVTATDPRYYRTPEALESLASSDYEEVFQKVRETPELISKHTFSTVEDAETDRYSALEVFLKDYRRYFAVGRYVPGKLPSLPFEDASFDRVLCAHFLFVYENSFPFLLDSLVELCRIAKKEVRIHPVVNNKGEMHPDLAQARKELEKTGYKSEVIQVDHEFFKGTDKTLVIERA